MGGLPPELQMGFMIESGIHKTTDTALYYRSQQALSAYRLGSVEIDQLSGAQAKTVIKIRKKLYGKGKR